MPEDIRVGSPLGSLFVEDPDEPQNRKTKYSFVQGAYRDTFTIETDPTHNEGIIKPIKVHRPAAGASDGGLGAPGMLRTQPGAAPGPEATKGPHLGQCGAGHVLVDLVTLELGHGATREGSVPWAGLPQNQTLRQRLRCIQLIWGGDLRKPQEP